MQWKTWSCPGVIKALFVTHQIIWDKQKQKCGDWNNPEEKVSGEKYIIYTKCLKQAVKVLFSV